ncbi:modifier of mdg4-like isoform X3 [Lutzomyia longipalpis]|uniref:modifier of mdg4-like isoform X3 n=1 Tax=Lutzomyia longipalpis TaxID=7200 RepID=UPI0024846B39|nr:modifier of mdg4-like isoform X3 [Lutzomyia longipalpis]
MADEELFSLCWNNFNTNLSAGFHESLVNGDLVDVTLAAEGQLVKAHRLVLSVCSPYFRKMFTNMPANQHAFVFLKDVTHSALKELIQFMYCGEVNVKQEALPAFISTAEALQIKGLTDSGESAPPPPSSPTKVATPSHSTASSPPRVRTQQRTVQRTTYKLESEDSADERTLIQVQHTQKRTAPRQTVALQSVPSAKRTKMETHTIETVEQPTETQTTARISEKSEAEFIDLPITETLSAKAEPVEEYAEDTAEDIEQEGEATYVEEDTYGDMKYDESYFTENDDTGTKPNVSGFSDTYTGESDPTVAEAQGSSISIKTEASDREQLIARCLADHKPRSRAVVSTDPIPPSQYSYNVKGMLVYKDYLYTKAMVKGQDKTIYWRCTKYNQLNCKAALKAVGKTLYVMRDNHNHSTTKQKTVNVIVWNEQQE